MSIFKRITKKAFIAAVILMTVTALAFGMLTFTFTAHADGKKDIEEFTPGSVGLSNPQFNETSGSYPATPSSWSAEGSGNVIAGVIDLTPSVYLGSDGGNKKFKLDQYDEYKANDAIPQTIFGPDSDYAGTDRKTLLINTASPSVVTAYSYKSSEMTFEPNSFYRVSAWVKTGSFAESTGATIKLNGLGTDCAFININTVKNIPLKNGIPDLNADNKYGWAEYRFYVRTSAALKKTVTLSLGIGDTVDGKSDEFSADNMPREANGYAMFDNISAERISSYDYAAETNRFSPVDGTDKLANESGTRIAVDLYDATFFEHDNVEIGTFSNATFGRNGIWDANAYYYEPDGPTYAGESTVDVYNSEIRIVDFENSAKFTQNPWSPLGRAEYDVENPEFIGGSNGNILMIYADKPAARGVASPEVTVSRFNYYRFSVWLKGDGVTDGAGISVAVKGQKNDTTANNELVKWYTDLSGDSADTAHYGWKEHIVYIKGSILSDLNVHFEFWLGAPNSMSSGTALFDNVTFTELSYSDFKAMSEADGGDVLELDASPAETGVANGNFMDIGDYDTPVFPMPVAEWKQLNTVTVFSNGFSKEKVNTDDAKHGIIPVDEDAFDLIREAGLIPGVTNPAVFSDAPDHTALLLSSRTMTAFCYQSPSLTVPVDKYYKLTVDMAVNGVSEDGYGASLVLKSTDGDVLSTIENITDTDRAFNTYTFYIGAPLSEKSLFVEIWLGLNDRSDNTKKQSDGNVYVKKVSFEEWTVEGSTAADEFATKLAEYREILSDKNRLKHLDYGMIGFDAPSLDYYDAYSYNRDGGFGTLYGWNCSTANANAIYGMFDSDNAAGVTLYSGFDKKDQSGNMIYIYNTEPNRTTFTYAYPLSLVSNTYYRLDVTVKVNITEEERTDGNGIGANIALTGASTEAFTNIKDTTTLVSENNPDSRDYETFKTYTFYISTGDNGGELGLSISLGGDERATQIQGRLVVADISLTSINNVAYENAQENLKEDYEKLVDFSEKDEDNSDGETPTEKPTGFDWWIIPTIIASSCLILALLIWLVVSLRDRLKKKKTVKYATEYDREEAFKNIDRLNSGDENEKPAKKQRKDEPADLDAFDEPAHVEPEPEETAPDAESEKLDEPAAPAKETADDLDD